MLRKKEGVGKRGQSINLSTEVILIILLALLLLSIFVFIISKNTKIFSP